MQIPPFEVSIDANGIYYLEKLPVLYDQFRSELLKQAAKNPQLVLAIKRDEKAPWGKNRESGATPPPRPKSSPFVAYTKEAAKQ